jgi:hypothetical protein
VGKLTPDSRVTKVAIVRVKKKPRGRSFEPGNGWGAEHRFKKGEPSANPSGRPLCKEVNAASREYLGAEIGKSPRVRTNAQAIVFAQGRKARKGDLGAASFLADRAEGKPATAVTINSDTNNVALLIESMRGRSAEVGMPEGHRELPAEGEDRS